MLLISSADAALFRALLPLKEATLTVKLRRTLALQYSIQHTFYCTWYASKTDIRVLLPMKYLYPGEIYESTVHTIMSSLMIVSVFSYDYSYQNNYFWQYFIFIYCIAVLFSLKPKAVVRYTVRNGVRHFCSLVLAKRYTTTSLALTEAETRMNTFNSRQYCWALQEDSIERSTTNAFY